MSRMNARIIRDLRGIIHPKLGEVLVTMSEEINTQRKLLAELAAQMQVMASTLDIQGQITHNIVLSERARRMKEVGVGVESDPTVTGEAEGDRFKS